MPWTGTTIVELVASGLGTGVCLRMVLDGIGWIWSFVTDGVRGVAGGR